MDFDVLAGLLADPSGPLQWDDYEMLGRFAAFLVDAYGLPAVLNVCKMTGRETDAAQLAEAMQAVLGAGPDQLIAALSEQPASCEDFDIYQSRVFACGVAPGSMHIGAIETTQDFTLEVGCDQSGSVPTLLGDEIERMLSFDAPTGGSYVVAVDDDATGLVGARGDLGDLVHADLDELGLGRLHATRSAWLRRSAARITNTPTQPAALSSMATNA